MRASDDVNQVHERFKEYADFLLVYLREAHPTDGWKMPNSEIEDPLTQVERDLAASQCCQRCKFAFPAVVDTMDDATAAAPKIDSSRRMYFLLQQLSGLEPVPPLAPDQTRLDTRIQRAEPDFLLESQQPSGDDQVTRGGDREELGQALHRAKDGRLERGHGAGH